VYQNALYKMAGDFRPTCVLLDAVKLETILLKSF
jgi:hypothetical protein